MTCVLSSLTSGGDTTSFRRRHSLFALVASEGLSNEVLLFPVDCTAAVSVLLGKVFRIRVIEVKDEC